MYIQRFDDFLFEQELNSWKNSDSMIFESQEWEENFNKIWNYLEKAAAKGEKYLIFIVSKIFNYFKTNPKMLIFVCGLLIGKYGFTKSDIEHTLPGDSPISAEELYAQSMEGKGLPEDEVDSEKKTVKFASSGDTRKFLKALASRESSNDPEKINPLGYLGKYQFGQIALEDILMKQPGETPEDYKTRINTYWPKNFGKIKNTKDYNFFKSKFSSKGVSFWPEHKQDLAIRQLLKNNKGYLGDYIENWEGKTKNGIKITKSGLLAGAHLLGPSNVKKFLDDGVVTKDANGTAITDYIEEFGGYNIKI